VILAVIGKIAWTIVKWIIIVLIILALISIIIGRPLV
jgi:uncharacterized membrane protein YukC